MEDTFSERLLKAMEAEKISNSVLSRRTGIAHTHICNIRVGNRKDITIKTVAKLLNAMPNIDARWLITGKI